MLCDSALLHECMNAARKYYCLQMCTLKLQLHIVAELAELPLTLTLSLLLHALVSARFIAADTAYTALTELQPHSTAL
jgi:hypothetical protein